MRIIQRGNPPRRTEWYYGVECVCSHCRPPTILVIEQKDQQVQSVDKLNEGNFWVGPTDYVVHVICPVCKNDIPTVRKDD